MVSLEDVYFARLSYRTRKKNISQLCTYFPEHERRETTHLESYLTISNISSVGPKTRKEYDKIGIASGIYTIIVNDKHAYLYCCLIKQCDYTILKLRINFELYYV